MNKITDKKNFKNAFKCRKCPGTSDENGCPMWWTWMRRNVTTDEEVVHEGCGFAIGMPFFLTENARAANSSSAELSKVRELVRDAVSQEMSIIQRIVRDSLQIGPAMEKWMHDMAESLSTVEDNVERTHAAPVFDVIPEKPKALEAGESNGSQEPTQDVPS